MKEFITRLTSRKLLLAVAAFLVFIANEQWAEALTVILTYLGVNTVAGVVTTYKTSSNSSQTTEPAPAVLEEAVSAVDHTGKIVSGRKIEEHAGDPDWE